MCTPRFSFLEFYNFLLFNFLVFIFFWENFFLPATFADTHTHHPRPLTTTQDPRHLATIKKFGPHAEIVLGVMMDARRPSSDEINIPWLS